MKKAGVGFQSEADQHESQSAQEGFQCRILTLTPQRFLQFRVKSLFIHQAERGLHPNSAKYPGDKAEQLNVHNLYSLAIPARAAAFCSQFFPSNRRTVILVIDVGSRQRTLTL